jgi:N-acetylneuraminic acid mutarotase
MIVFGGFSSGSIYPNDHAKYSPTSDTWTTLATLNAPTARIEHSAVSTGNTVLIFGGGGLQALSSNNGAQYNPISDEWIPFSMPNDPTGRRKHTALWTGSKMIVYGGYDQYPSNLHSGGIFDPILNSWIETNPVSSKVDYLKAYGISGHSTVWTGSYLIMFGGIAQNGSHRLNEGAIYRPFDSDSDYSEIGRSRPQSARS